MRNKMFAVAALLLGLLCSQVMASDYSYNGTYYYDTNGQAYTRYQTVEYYWSNGCRYPRYVWKYTPVAGVYAVNSGYGVGINSQTEGWRSKLLDIAAAHKKYQDQIAASANEHQEFLESVKELGLTGVVTNYNFVPTYANAYNYMQAHGFSPGLNVQNYAQSYGDPGQQVAQQGNTVYGYREVADIYGNVNLGELYQRALRLREQSAGYEAAANQDAHKLVDNLGARAAAIEELRAKADIMAKLVDGLKPEPTTRVVKEFYSSDAAKTVKGAAAGTAILDRLNAVVQSKCVSCHSGDKPNGGLNLQDLSALPADAGRKILDRLESEDPVKRMPLAPGMKPGKPLTIDEKALFFIAAYGLAPQSKE